MSSYLITWKAGAHALAERHLIVTGKNMIEAAEQADRKIFRTYPMYMLCGVQLVSPSMMPALAENDLEAAR